jgi:DNA-directed RNA polymerase specialized sigma24 family protein
MRDLYDRYGRLVCSLILRMVRHSAAAEDLVQETFLRVWNRMQAFDQERGALGPWVLEKRTTDRELTNARLALQQSVAERDRLEPAFTFLNQPEIKQVNFGQGQPAPPRANFFLNPRRGVLLIDSNLAALPAGKRYEMWVIPR